MKILYVNVYRIQFKLYIEQNLNTFIKEQEKLKIKASYSRSQEKSHRVE